MQLYYVLMMYHFLIQFPVTSQLESTLVVMLNCTLNNVRRTFGKLFFTRSELGCHSDTLVPRNELLLLHLILQHSSRNTYMAFAKCSI